MRMGSVASHYIATCSGQLTLDFDACTTADQIHRYMDKLHHTQRELVLGWLIKKESAMEQDWVLPHPKDP